MANIKSHPVFSTILIVLGVAALTEGWFIYAGHKARTKAVMALDKANDEFLTLHGQQPPSHSTRSAPAAATKPSAPAASAATTPMGTDASALQSPTPTAENQTQIAADYKKTTDALAVMQAELQGTSEVSTKLHDAPVPTDPSEAYFSINTFVDAMRKKYADAVPPIKLKENERFGFSLYAHDPPQKDLIPEVFHEQQVITYLLDALYDAHIQSLVSVQRELPLTKAERETLDHPKAPVPGQTTTSPAFNAGDGTGDLFSIDPTNSVRKPGFVDATAFRLTFIGETNSLRSLLNKLGTFELPLVVRSVEVDPSEPDPAPPQRTEDDDGNPVQPLPKPKVEKLFSKFTVTLEYIDLVPAAPNPSVTAN